MSHNIKVHNFFVSSIDTGTLSTSTSDTAISEQSSTRVLSSPRTSDVEPQPHTNDVEPHPHTNDVEPHPHTNDVEPHPHTNDVEPHPHTNDVEPQPHTSDVESHFRASGVEPHPRDQFPDEETCENREDSGSIAGSSSVGFESPDDEEHELRMRYFPPGDMCGDGVYQDPYQRLESERDERPLYGNQGPASDSGGEPLYGTMDSTSEQHFESDNVGDISERHASGDEFSNTDATCIPTDSTYIDYSELSADENVRSRHDYDSSADMVDSSGSDVSEFEHTGGDRAERVEPRTEKGSNLVETEFSTDENVQNADDGGEKLDTCNETDKRFDESDDNRQSNDRHVEETSQVSLEDETISRHEGDYDTTEDETGYSRIEMASTPGVLVGDKGEVLDTRRGEVGSSEDGKVVEKIDSGVVRGDTSDKDDSTEMYSTEHDRISTDTGGQVDTIGNEGEDSMKDTSVYDKDNILPDRVPEETQDADTHEPAGELKDSLETDVTDVLEDKELLTEEDDDDEISHRTEGVYAEELPQNERDVGAADWRISLDSRTSVPTSDFTSLTGGPTNAGNTKDACTTSEAFDPREEVTTEDTIDLHSDADNNIQTVTRDVVETSDADHTPSPRTMSIERTSQNVKEVSSSSDPSFGDGSRKIESLDDENFCEANQSHDSRDEVCERDSSSRDEDLDDATDGADSSTDRENTQKDDTEEKTSYSVEENIEMNPIAGREDDDTLSEESENSNEEHVTSSNEHVKGRDEHVKGRDEHVKGQVDRNEHVTRGDEHVIVPDEHVIVPDEHVIVPDEHVIVQDEHVASEDEHVIINDEHVDNNDTEEQNDTKEGNEVVEGMENEEEFKALTDEVADSGMSMETKDEGDTTVTSAEDTTLRDLEKRGGNEVQREGKERVHEGTGWSPTIESTSSIGDENMHMEKNEAASSNLDIHGGENVSTTDSNMDENSSPGHVMEMAVSYTNQDTHIEQYGEDINNDISSTVEETNIVSQHTDTDISSTFGISTGNRHFVPEPDNGSELLTSSVSTSSNVAEQRDNVASSSSVAMQLDNVTGSNVPNISDVSSSDTSESLESANEPESSSCLIGFPDCLENANEAISRTSSSEADFPDSAENANEAIDFPDSAHILGRRPGDSTYLRNQDMASLSRRSSEDSTSHSDEPSTTNFNEATVSNSMADSHENISENEAESLTKYDEGEIRTEKNAGVHSLNEKDNIVDSSTVSPVSFTEDTCVDTTEYLGLNRDNPASTSDNNVESTGYFGMNIDNSGSLGTPEGTVGTTVGITSSTKYDITVEAISSDEELEEGEIAETVDDVTGNDVTPCDVTPEHMITSSSGSYYPPLDTIPISPPADSDEPSSSFPDFGTFTYSSTQHAGSSTQHAGSSTQHAGSSTQHAGSSTQLAGSSTQHAGSSHVAHSVFPFSALNVRSAPNSNCSSPVPVGFGSGCNTPIRFQQADSTPIRFQLADSSNMLTPQYEPLSDDESTESHDTDE